MINDDEEFDKYFQGYRPGCLPEKILIAILSTLGKDETMGLVKQAKNKRAYENQTKENKMIKIIPIIKNEFIGVLPRSIY